MVFNINSEYAKISEVIPGLFISGVCALTPATIAANNIKLIVNATEEVPNVKSLGKVEYLKLWLKDDAEADLRPHFFEPLEQVKTMLKSGNNVLIHSVQGTSRCVALCMAYLLKFEGKSFKEAHTLLKAKRSLVRINSGFWRQLRAFEREIKRIQSFGGLPAGPICEEPRTSDNTFGEFDKSSQQISANSLNCDFLQNNGPASEALSVLAQVFYREIKKRAKCRRKISPVFKPVLETLYEQAEIVA